MHSHIFSLILLACVFWANGTPSVGPSPRPTAKPTVSPTKPSASPSVKPVPTRRPTGPSLKPTRSPSTFKPSIQPSMKPSGPSFAPSTATPSLVPSPVPSAEPTVNPTNPTAAPTVKPTVVAGTCDLRKYEDWKNFKYGDYRPPGSDPFIYSSIASDPSFWRYQSGTQRKVFPLTYDLAMQLAVSACVNDFDMLYYYLAGRVGPIDIQHSYKIMCREVCLAADELHQDAMEYSGCSCLELSTQPSDQSWHIEGDFCRENTARLLCDRVGYCGIWDCRIDDFMCPRYEWNKKHIPLKGIGSCERGAASRSVASGTILTTLIIAALTAAFVAGGVL